MRFFKNFIPQSIKNIYHLQMAVLANLWHGFPSRELKVIGVTGTNGKTTTCQMIARILEESGKKTAMFSTINFKIGEKEWVNATKFTTLSSFAVQKFIRRAVAAGCEYLVLETSSHALDQHRVWGIDYQAAVITNVTREHLDYHRTMEKYRQAKLKLFKKPKIVMVNMDMERPEDFLQFNNKKKYGFTCHPEWVERVEGFNEKNNLDSSTTLGTTLVSAENIELGIDHSKFIVNSQRFTLNMPGLFNVENALAAVCVGLAENISLKKMAESLEKIKIVPGRLEFVPNNRELNIIIDYAVTPDSLEKLYKLIVQIKEAKSSFGNLASKNSKIIAVLGACGERDRGKRPIMGEIAAKYADYVIVTNEDPYDESPQRIIDEVASGIARCYPELDSGSKEISDQVQNDKYYKIENVNFWKILNRREAIKKALQTAKPGDFVAVTGKGAEVSMAIGKKRIPWNDKEVILEELKNL